MKAGDNVRWLEIKATKKKIDMKIKEGKIVEMCCDGVRAVVKQRRSKLIKVNLSKLEINEGPNQLTRLIQKVGR